MVDWNYLCLFNDRCYSGCSFTSIWSYYEEFNNTRRKRGGHLISKMRFVSAQLEAYLSNDVWLRNARHANSMASLLSKGLAAIPDVKLVHPTQANEIFVSLPNSIVKHLNNEGYDVNHDELDGKAARFVAAWNSEKKDIDKLLKTIAKK